MHLLLLRIEIESSENNYTHSITYYEDMCANGKCEPSILLPMKRLRKKTDPSSNSNKSRSTDLSIHHH